MLVRDKTIREIYQQAARKHNLPTSAVRDAVESALAFVAHTMSAGLFEGVRLPGFGTFFVKLMRLQKVNELYEKNRKRYSKKDETL